MRNRALKGNQVNTYKLGLDANEVSYILQVIAQRPIAEAHTLFVKLQAQINAQDQMREQVKKEEKT